MAPTISLSPSRYQAQLPAHRFRQGNRDVYYFTLDLAALDGLLPQRVDDSVVREANRRLTPSHARNIQQYLEDRDNWLLGALLLGIAPDGLEFEPYQDEDGNEVSPNFGELSILTSRANTMRIFDGQHRRRAIQDTLDRLGQGNIESDKLGELHGSSVPIVLYAEGDIRALRQMFTDASRTKRIEANVVTRFDKRDPFNLAAMHLAGNSRLFGGRIEMDATTVFRASRTLISVNQLAQVLRVMTVGYGSRVSRLQSELHMQELDALYERCLDWSDRFLPSARWEFDGLVSGNIRDEDIPIHRAESLAYSTTFIRILGGCYHDWMQQAADWPPLASFIKDARLETGGGRENLLVDAGAMLPGDTAPSGRRQEVEGAIKFIVQQAGQATRSDSLDDELPW